MPKETNEPPAMVNIEALSEQVLSDAELDAICEMLMASLGKPFVYDTGRVAAQ